MMYEAYEMVCGIETHIELLTKTKMFCSCKNSYGKEPNTHCCPVCLGMPGALPTINAQAVRYAIAAGIALGCRINNMSQFARKSYFYPDLPKGYQITQAEYPICSDGAVVLNSGKKINIERIHLEEDAGKLSYDNDKIYIDYNRCGVPLIEIVSRPDISTPDEAKEYCEKLHDIIKYLGISDCKMQEGSMRCDVNISVRKKNDTEYGIKTEIKNINSFNFTVRALRFEFERQIGLISNGERVRSQTRRYDEKNGETVLMREKEGRDDYRYFPEPDLPDINISSDEINEIEGLMPELPDNKIKRYINEYGLSADDANNIVKYRKTAEYFECVVKNIKNPKNAAKLMLGQMFSLGDKENGIFGVTSEQLMELVLLIENGKINMQIAKATLAKMISTGESVEKFLCSDDFAVVSDEEIEKLCREILNENRKMSDEYKSGNEKMLNCLVGIGMKKTNGRIDAKKLKEIIKNVALNCTLKT